MANSIKANPVVDKSLLRIGNTILCNYGMTSNPDLHNGRMGVCLFLYEYARYTEIKEYEDFADEMINPILEALHKGQSEENIRIMAGIGIGVIYLITRGFLEDTEDCDALAEVDNLLLETVASSDVPSDILTYASLYFIYRFMNYRVNLDEARCMALAEKIVKLYQEEPDMECESSTIKYILRNAEYIIGFLGKNGMVTHDGESILYEDNDVTVPEGNVLESLWNNYLFGSGKGLFKEQELDVSDLSRNCFYDPDRNVGMLCVIGLNLMARNR